MTDRVSMEGTRLALSLVRTLDEEENQRALMMALRAFDDPLDRLAVHFHAARLLAMELRQTAKAAGVFDKMISQIDSTLFSLVVEEDQ